MRPLALGFYPEVCPSFCEGDLDLPAAEKVVDELLGGECLLIGDERLWVELALRIAQHHPADGHGRLSAAEPHGGIGKQIEFACLAAVPGEGASGPDRGGILQACLEGRKPRTL